MKNFEQELKLALTSNEYNTLKAMCKDSGIVQTNYYFYADGMSLDTLVRLREKQGKYEFTVKIQRQHTNDIMTADEYNTEVSKALADVLIECGINGVQLRSLLGNTLPDYLSGESVNYRYCDKLTTLRSIWTTPNGLKAELDKNEYLDTCDYELECESTEVEKLEQLKTILCNYGIAIKSSCAKSKRFFDKLASTPMLLNL